MDPRQPVVVRAARRSLLLSLILVCVANAAQARVETIRWSHPSPAGVTSFRLYVRAQGASYGASPAWQGLPTPSGGVYSTTLTLSDTGTWYVVGKAVNASGESAVSNELSFVGPTAPVCGNGTRETGEACDDGNTTAGDGCRANCTVEMCGDGIRDSGEACDDGNLSSGDGCRANCTTEICGDRIVDAPAEQCDDGNTTLGDGCESCRTARIPACGDGIRDSGEACDDGNLSSGDGCRSNCTTEICGDRIVDAPAEQCDDGNTTLGDGCESCRTARIPRCGDGIRDSGEACDDGNTTAGDGCRANCTVEMCGDGIRDGGEACDDGNLSSGDGCRSNCTTEICGDRIVDAPAEQCDDGNTTLGDGCESCRTARIAACGDGFLDVNEACDDGNQAGGDGCDAQCEVEVAGALPYRIDAAGGPTDAGGNVWREDDAFASGGTAVEVAPVSVSNTSLDALFWTTRVGSATGRLRFELPVPGLGPYQVKLYFAEVGGAVTARNQRIFDVVLEDGVARIEDVDVFRITGGSNRALMQQLYVLVDDGSLSIEIQPVVGQPMISAIEVLEGGTPPRSPTVRACAKPKCM
jgi:cysteine-rich repeat protein